MGSFEPICVSEETPGVASC